MKQPVPPNLLTGGKRGSSLLRRRGFVLYCVSWVTLSVLCGLSVVSVWLSSLAFPSQVGLTDYTGDGQVRPSPAGPSLL